jgi:hypothetical protein
VRAGALEGGDLLPGFTVPLARVFPPELPAPDPAAPPA